MPGLRGWSRRAGAVLALAGAGLLALSALAQESAGPADARPVHVAPLTGVIGPANAAFITGAIEDAEDGARALVIEMDTPGGLVDAMREINLAILSSQVPVIVYVAPQGARATSAGVYILYASHLAAMAPGTTVGAATPVEFGPASDPPAAPQDAAEGDSTDGEVQDSADEDGAGEVEAAPSSAQAMRNKVVNDSVAQIRSLAELRGRNADWAERAVREGVSLTADEAVEMNVAELIAPSLDALLEQASGRTLTLVEGREVTLDLAGASIERVEPGFALAFLQVITNPNIAFLLINLGFIGLLASFYNGLEPVTAIAGLLCLIVGFYGLNTLPVSYAGAALIVLGLGLLIAEAFVASFGILAISGLAVFALGAVMLVDTDIEALQLDWRLIAGVTAALGALTFAALFYGLAAQARKPVAGRESLKGMEGRVLEWSGTQGFVHADGERWHAVSKDALAPGDPVVVTGIDGLTLTVKKTS
ncbi:NfeD family protein [Marinicauda sp. Alg238-R41]|uniref:NfeD family protein n=1 Tax=Marinicauda sp. Alg238-R41 TaxID=2993447 RepID=UPI0022E4896F|nr:nodulation protein NfeD [Marinicauda sp. Alg238-R41]